MFFAIINSVNILQQPGPVHKPQSGYALLSSNCLTININNFKIKFRFYLIYCLTVDNQQ